MEVSAELGDDIVTIMSGANQLKISPFMKFFWEEQQKYLKSSSTGTTYHPMIIRYCLSLVAKSSAAYDEIWYDEKMKFGVMKKRYWFLNSSKSSSFRRLQKLHQTKRRI